MVRSVAANTKVTENEHSSSDIQVKTKPIEQKSTPNESITAPQYKDIHETPKNVNDILYTGTKDQGINTSDTEQRHISVHCPTSVCNLKLADDLKGFTRQSQK